MRKVHTSANHGLDARLTSLEKTGPQTYKALITEPYCD